MLVINNLSFTIHYYNSVNHQERKPYFILNYYNKLCFLLPYQLEAAAKMQSEASSSQKRKRSPAPTPIPKPLPLLMKLLYDSMYQ